MVQSFIDHPHEGTRTSLSDEQAAALRSMLEEVADEHRRRVEENDELFETLAADVSIDAAERQAARLAAEQAAETCARAEAALAAIDDGTYGRCGGCGAAIPFERLEAVPLADTCVRCPPR